MHLQLLALCGKALGFSRETGSQSAFAVVWQKKTLYGEVLNFPVRKVLQNGRCFLTERGFMR